MKQQETRSFRATVQPGQNHPDLRLRLIQVAGGDVAFADKLREMIWLSYCDQGRPYGPTEEGMFRWLDQQQ